MSETCLDANTIIQYIQSGYLPQELIDIIKPLECMDCSTQFADNVLLQNHRCTDDLRQINPLTLTFSQLKVELSKLGKPVSGNKKIYLICFNLFV